MIAKRNWQRDLVFTKFVKNRCRGNQARPRVAWQREAQARSTAATKFSRCSQFLSVKVLYLTIEQALNKLTIFPDKFSVSSYVDLKVVCKSKILLITCKMKYPPSVVTCRTYQLSGT